MKEITYKITRGYSESVTERTEVTGTFLFDLYGYQWAVHPEPPLGYLVVSEVSTGFELESGRFFKDAHYASKWAWSYLLKKGEILTRHYVEHARMKLQGYEAI